MTPLESGRPTPEIAVVVPMHDSREWIAETLRSILAQTLPSASYELVIVDDGSTDDSVDVATAVLRDASIEWRLVRSSQGGPSHARNLGWKAARGSWIQFLDSDDLIHCEKLSIQLHKVHSTTTPAGVLYSDFTTLTEFASGWTTASARRCPRVSENTLEQLLRAEHFIQLGACLLNREWLERVGGFDESQWFIEDVNLFLRLAMAGAPFVHAMADFPSMYYRQRSTSLSRTSSLGFAEGCFKNAKLAENHWRSSRSLTRDRRLLLAGIYVFSGKLASTASPTASTKMLSGVERLLIPRACTTKTGLRMVARVLGYRVLGRSIATKLESMYHRARRSVLGNTLSEPTAASRG